MILKVWWDIYSYKKINCAWFPRRSLGTAGQPGDAASGRCGPCGDRGLLDDHPAAAVALRRAAAQRAAPGLAPEDWGGKDSVDTLSALCTHGLCTGVVVKELAANHSWAEAVGMFYRCLKISKPRLALTAQARPQGHSSPCGGLYASPHICWISYSVCVCECVCFYDGVGFWWAAQHLIVSLIGSVLLATACQNPTGSVTSVLARCQSWHNVDQLCHDMVKS